ncbi:AAA family ATPase [Deinococcus sp.]|uniref:AAA family ATPase n=1 Tax=Deinococcus sp. TaxID=47478 RepID=UPI00286E0F64|nr:AAA family ATPase [Deinococcus sp.]
MPDNPVSDDPVPDDRLPAELLSGLSATAHDRWLPLAAQPLLVLVGVTGVGKSTALAALEGLKRLPDRREVTDAVMIVPQAGQAVADREQRFALTAQYRRTHPGGMAQALGSLHADPERWSGRLVFDGLRGQGEVEYAARQFPLWRFVSLHAPDLVRVRRLLGRADAFDMVAFDMVAFDVVAFDVVDQTVQATGVRADARTFNLLAELEVLDGVDEVFGSAQLHEIAALSAQGFTPADLLAKTRIVLSERRNYDPQAARRVLNVLPDWRSLDLDTSLFSAQEVARAIADWLPGAGPVQP